MGQAATSASRPGTDFLAGGGEAGGILRRVDWRTSPLGPPERWPESLKIVIRLMLTTNHPLFVFWGADHLCFYNDAYSASIGAEKHPRMLGAKGREMWPEIWSIIGPQIDQVMAGKGATWHENHLIPMVDGRATRAVRRRHPRRQSRRRQKRSRRLRSA